MASVTLAVATRALAEQLGDFQTFIVSDVAVGAEPSRWAIARNTSSHIRSDGTPLDRYVGRWLLVTVGGQIGQTRRVIHAIPELGALAVDNPFGSALAVSDQVDLTWPLPSFTTGGVTGLDAIIRMALRDLWVYDRLELTTVSGQYEYALSSYTWLARADQMVAVYDPPRISGGVRRRSRIAWELSFDNGTAYLKVPPHHSPYTASGFTFQVEVKRPAFSLVGAESSTGPLNRTDTVLVEQADVVTVGLKYAYEYLAKPGMLAPEERQKYADLVPIQEARCRALAHYDPHTTNGLLAAEEAA